MRTNLHLINHMIVTLALTMALFLPRSISTIAGEDSYFDPLTGYRINHYRAPVPEKAPGGKRVRVDDVEQIIADKSVILIDVMASTGPGPDLKTGAWRMVKIRENIPGSVWLPNVGKGKLSDQILNYFKDNLKRLTKGNKSHPIVIYCQADCWMSWNAVKRASELGYTNIYWYPEGTDGWLDWDGRLVVAKPVPLPPTMNSSVRAP